ncbi:hypothetical protein PMAYCL1PPCAC_28893 [Pristionchus mayeri]|uniref:Ground-like domain-containing protein n=1 Tax=Pristionchus mayeri TaxID=1317129 RepID=A0AAN5D8B1_9BILA|nr:hypothetical protein PMAYCL1PPCAC_28893 [Pristionchus mayeri]
MRSIILLALPTVILAGPFCMCPNGQAGQALSCPPQKEPSCPEPKPCEEEKKPFPDFEMPNFPTLPPLDTKRMFSGFSMPTLPPSLNFFPNLFESTPCPIQTTQEPETPVPTAPPPPPMPMEAQTLPPFVNPTLAPYNQRMPIGVPPSGAQIPYGMQPQQGMEMRGQQMNVQPMQQMQQPQFMQGTQQFSPMGAAVVSGATEAPMANTWRSGGGQQMMMGQMNQQMQHGQQMGMTRGGETLLSGTISSSEDDMELVRPQTYKKTFSLYEGDKGRLPHSIEHEIRDFGSFRNPVKRAAPHPDGGEVSSIEKCNDERLKKIILENIDSNPSTSKRAIQKAASEQIGGLFDVICSTHDFSYLANTQLFCEAGNDDVTCFAFLHTLLQ